GLRYSIYRKFPVRLQSMAVSAIASVRWRHESSPAFRKLVVRLQKMQYWPLEDIEEYRRGRLAEVLLSARNTPYYEDMIPEEDVVRKDPAGVLKSLPVLDKETVARDPGAFIPVNVDQGKLFRHGTSGTTGFPLRVYWTRESMDWERALIWRQRIAAGCRFGLHWIGMVGGHRIVPIEQRNPPFWRECPPARLTFMSTYHLSPENALHYHRYLSEREIDFLSGYPSALYALALSFRKNGLSLPLKGAFYGAEPLHAFQREAIESVFDCYIWDYYGLTERVVSASEFECRNGLHVNWENSFFEILDSSGRDAEPGQIGELVGTSLSNTGFTLLRYRTGDMTRLLDGECTCGRLSPRIAAIGTKVEDLLVMPDGSLLSASNLTFPFKGMSHIRQSQIYQKVPEELIVRIVPDVGFVDEDAERLGREIKEILPAGVKVVIRRVESIPLNSSGKFSFAVSEVDREKPGPEGPGLA
ncbi:MAG TPA: hypothetical protein PKM02_10125, partial [Candidatus Fermentibacter daniensis]|nr:hypothetical protein [Candidatus Fermentibacter daniensis]